MITDKSKHYQPIQLYFEHLLSSVSVTCSYSPSRHCKVLLKFTMSVKGSQCNDQGLCNCVVLCVHTLQRGPVQLKFRSYVYLHVNVLVRPSKHAALVPDTPFSTTQNVSRDEKKQKSNCSLLQYGSYPQSYNQELHLKSIYLY